MPASSAAFRKAAYASSLVALPDAAQEVGGKFDSRYLFGLQHGRQLFDGVVVHGLMCYAFDLMTLLNLWHWLFKMSTVSVFCSMTIIQ